MILLALSIFAIFATLCVSEWMWRKKLLKGEVGRKFVHILIGTFIASWPFYMSFRLIQLASLAFLAVIILSRRFSIFNAIHAVKRKTWGEVFFAASIGLLPFVSSSRLVFAAAVLHMSLADGMAGLIGTRFGKSTRFYMFGQAKSLAGSLAFIVLSYAIVLGFFKASRLVGVSDINWIVLALPILATLLETASVKGADNLLVPLLVASVLNSVL